jgi:hypothetical protein
VTPEIAEKLLAFYRDPNAPIHTKKNRRQWGKTLAELGELKTASIH